MINVVTSGYRILKTIMILAIVGVISCTFVYYITGNYGTPNSYAEFCAGYSYCILIATMPIAWAVGRLKITLNFKEEEK